MKKLVPLLIVFFSFIVEAQNPDLFQTWYLSEQGVDLGGSFYFTGPDVPRLTINSDLTYNAVDGCDEYGGTFIYIEDSIFQFKLLPSNLFDTTPNCNSNTLFELKTEEELYCYLLSPELFQFELFPGFISIFRNSITLGSDDNQFNKVTSYPNPVLNTFHIYDPENIVDSYTISDMSGKIIKEGVRSKGTISISNFTSGVYFLKLQSGENQTTKKLIKN